MFLFFSQDLDQSDYRRGLIFRGGQDKMAKDLWFRSFRRISGKKGVKETDKAVIGILTFEVATLMSKLVKLWNILSNKEFLKLKEQIANSIGIQKLVSDDDFYPIELVLREIVDSLRSLAKSTARLGKKCTDSVFYRFEQFVKDPLNNEFDWIGWEYRWKKMDRKVKKMERFVAVTTQLSQEFEVLTELERSFRRMQLNREIARITLLEFQQKVIWQRQEVRNLREMSPWNRTYDYTIRLLMRSILTVVERIKCVFEANELASLGDTRDEKDMSRVFLSRTLSFSSPIPFLAHPMEKTRRGSYSGPLRRSISKFDLLTHRRSNRQSSNIDENNFTQKIDWFSQAEIFEGNLEGTRNSPSFNRCQSISSASARLNDVSLNKMDKIDHKANGSISFRRNSLRSSIFNSEGNLLDAPPFTLGSAGLALHYANVIILIEKLSSSPHLIGLDAREDLYNMLPTAIRTALRARLKSCTKTTPSSAYDPALAGEWNLAIIRMLEWISPLAHNTIRWHSERDVEKRYVITCPCMLLVQTLYYANQKKAEAAITELLVGLNYVCRASNSIYRKKFPGIGGCYSSLYKPGNLAYPIL